MYGQYSFHPGGILHARKQVDVVDAIEIWRPAHLDSYSAVTLLLRQPTDGASGHGHVVAWQNENSACHYTPNLNVLFHVSNVSFLCTLERRYVNATRRADIVTQMMPLTNPAAGNLHVRQVDCDDVATNFSLAVFGHSIAAPETRRGPRIAVEFQRCLRGAGRPRVAQRQFYREVNSKAFPWNTTGVGFEFLHGELERVGIADESGSDGICCFLRREVSDVKSRCCVPKYATT